VIPERRRLKIAEAIEIRLIIIKLFGTSDWRVAV
jgi:hypothetical protein